MELNKVYVVAGVDGWERGNGIIGLFLVGVTSTLCQRTGLLVGWRHTRFRLLADLKAASVAAQQEQTLSQTK